MAALLDHQGVERVVFGGLSMGGQIAMAFCREYRRRVRGSDDAFTTQQDAQRMRELGQSELLWLPGIGHMPNLEAPDVFNQAVVRLLDRVR